MKLSICAIFRNEAPYLREWIEFHRMVGVEKFYLYQNRSDDNYESVLGTYVAHGIVELKQWPYLPPCQVQAYQYYIDNHQGQCDWTAFLDLDEFLWSPCSETVTGVLDSFPKHWGAVAVNWMCFGASGKEGWEDIPVIERFTWRKGDAIPSNDYVKPIVRMQSRVTIDDPHFANVPTFTPSGRENFGPYSIPHDYSLLCINHYGSKSRQEWVKRQLLGKPCATNSPSPEDCYKEIQGWDVLDYGIQRFLPELKRRVNLCEM